MRSTVRDLVEFVNTKFNEGEGGSVGDLPP